MFFAKFTVNGQTTAELYDSWDKFIRDTFNPTTEVITLIEFKIHGKNYQTRQESLRTLAINWSNSDIEGISYGEIADIENWFRLKGKRFGLLEEFRENAIC